MTEPKRGTRIGIDIVPLAVVATISVFCAVAPASARGSASCPAGAPLIIDLGVTGAKTYWKISEHSDVIFINSKGTKAGALRVDGARNIDVLGGSFTPAAGIDTAATINLQNLTGNVHIEGVRIDNKQTGARDGIGVAGAKGHAPAVTIRNSRIENVQGTKEGVHGDIFQPYGPIASLDVFEVSGSTAYQGFFLDPQFDPAPDRVRLENVNIVPNAGTGPQPKAYWFYSEDSARKFPVYLRNVYVQQAATGQSGAANVWPAEHVRLGNEISWPNLPIRGVVTVGAPSAGDFARKDDTGEKFDYEAALVNRLLERLAMMSFPSLCPTADSAGN